MTEPVVNPIYAQGETELFHAGEAPPAGHAFYPTAFCGAVMTGERFSDLPKGVDLCATDAKRLGITQEPAKTDTVKKDDK